MTPLLFCALLRIAAPQSVALSEFAATDPVLRLGARVRLSQSAAYYLRTETWSPAHPKMSPGVKRHVGKKRRR